MSKHRLIRITGVLLLCSCLLQVGCRSDDRAIDRKADQSQTLPNSSQSQLIFNIRLNRPLYELSDYGEPPQIAIWIENEKTEEIQTVFVTYRTAKARWKGKMECPVSLPYWAGRWNKEAKTTGHPTVESPVLDAVTGATPKDELSARVAVPSGSRWNCFVEVNVASDFSVEYPSYVNHMPDPHMNGQPSAIFKSSITAVNGASTAPVLVGRTEQIRPSVKIIEETDSLTTIKDIFLTLEVTCQKNE